MLLQLQANGQSLVDGNQVNTYSAFSIDPATQAAVEIVDYDFASLDAIAGTAFRQQMAASYTNVNFGAALFVGLAAGVPYFLSAATGCNVGDTSASFVARLIAAGPSSATIVATLTQSVGLAAVADQNTLVDFEPLSYLGGDIYVVVPDNNSTYASKVGVAHLGTAGTAEYLFTDFPFSQVAMAGQVSVGETAYLAPGTFAGDDNPDDFWMAGFLLAKDGNAFLVKGSAAGTNGSPVYPASAQAGAASAAGITPDTLSASTYASATSNRQVVRGQSAAGAWTYGTSSAPTLTDVNTSATYNLTTLLTDHVGNLRGYGPGIFTVGASTAPPAPSFWTGVVSCDVGTPAVIPTNPGSGGGGQAN